MFRVLLTLIGICDTGAVDDHIRTVNGTEVDHFICVCDIQLIKVCVQSLDLHWIQNIIQCPSDLSVGTYDPYF